MKRKASLRKPQPEPIVLYVTVDASELIRAIKAATRKVKELKAALAAVNDATVRIASSSPAEPDTSGLFELRGGAGTR
jgi:hypothetical protein